MRDESIARDSRQRSLLDEDIACVDRFFGDSTDSREAARDTRLSQLLGLLSAVDEPPDRSLVDLAFWRVKRIAPPVDEPTLINEDADALDALFLGGLEPSRVTSALRQRAALHARISDLVSQTPLSERPSADLADATIARVEDAVADEAARLDITGRRARVPRVRLADLVTIAAMILVGFSVVLPMTSAMREESRIALCRGNMRAAALGLGQYALSNREALPVITAGSGVVPWWNVGEDPAYSNSANLYHLVRTRLVGLEELACAGNRLAPTNLTNADSMDWESLEEVSYSYRVMVHAPPVSWGHPARVVVMADRSPVVLRAYRGFPIDPLENSPNHHARGQHVLFADGRSEWLTTPILHENDNIWLPRSIERAIERVANQRRIAPIRGVERPESADDAFVGP